MMAGIGHENGLCMPAKRERKAAIKGHLANF